MESMQRTYSALVEVLGPFFGLGKAGGIQELGDTEAIAVITLLHITPCRIPVSVITTLCYKQSCLNHMAVYYTFQLPSVFFCSQAGHTLIYSHSRLNICYGKNSVFCNFSTSPPYPNSPELFVLFSPQRKETVATNLHLLPSPVAGCLQLQ